ncbi:FMN-dependent NADH-azoreductase [Microtetraspora malaysiensis]|uniref:FMN-dependent NADH-azoreductase n=1 Tax=Microtetraspora malaysiensis TaxID=161358 RepID=UPI00082D6AF2|nr:NAD(P)H-dependent oxidoreductase [Microtetraspora malaysiensis]
MTSLLHVDSSANRSDESISRRLTALFADTWRARHGSAGYTYRDLAAAPVPPLDSAYCALGRRVERDGLLPPARVGELIASPAERREWELTHPLITELLSADIVLIGAPMYNFSIPASLKAWIDRVSFPGAFSAPGTGDSLLRDTKVVVITTRGGAYGPGTPMEAWDFQTSYLRAYFAKHGVSDGNLSFITAEMTLADLVPHLAGFRSSAASSLATAQAEVTALAAALTEPARVRVPGTS